MGFPTQLSVIVTQSSCHSFRYNHVIFLRIKQRPSTTFHLQTNGQTKRQNSIIKAYLWAFINQKYNDWAKLLSIIEFAYNNAKNACISHTSFELNYNYHFRVFYKEDLDPHSKSNAADELADKLENLMTVCQKNLYNTQKFRNRLKTIVWSLRAIFLVIKFGWIINILKQNIIISSKPGFSALFEYYTQ